MKNIKKIFFKILFNLISLFYKPFLKYKKPVRFKNIAVLGKGESVKFFVNNYHVRRKDIDLIILTNYQKNDLLSFELKKYITDIPIILLGNITEPLLYLSNVSNLTIYEVIVQRFYPGKTNSITNFQNTGSLGKLCYLSEEANSGGWPNKPGPIH